MNWFKHSTSLHNDPFIDDLYAAFGHAGYCIFLILHEMYGLSFGRSRYAFNTISPQMILSTLSAICQLENR